MIPRLALYGLAGAAIVAGVMSWGHTRYKAGEARGEARIQAKWDSDKARWLAANEEVKRDAEKQIKAANDARIEAVRTRDEELAAIAADNSSLAGMLRQARDRIRGLTAAEATSARGLDVASGIAASAAAALGSLEQRYDEYDRACRIDAADKTALQAILRPVAEIVPAD